MIKQNVKVKRQCCRVSAWSARQLQLVRPTAHGVRLRQGWKIQKFHLSLMKHTQHMIEVPSSQVGKKHKNPIFNCDIVPDTKHTEIPSSQAKTILQFLLIFVFTNTLWRCGMLPVQQQIFLVEKFIKQFFLWRTLLLQVRRHHLSTSEAQSCSEGL